MKWYAVHTYSGQESKVKSYIEEKREDYPGRLGSVLLPMQDVVQVRHGRKIRRPQKDYPGYLLVEMEFDDETFNVVRNIPGVANFVGNRIKGQFHPQTLRQAEVDRILGRSAQTPEPVPGQIVQIPFRPGDAVRINEGPFKDFDGTVEEVHSDRGKLKVMVSVFGRSTPVELNFLQVSEV